MRAEGARLPAASGGDVVVAGIALVADCAGALYWPEEGLLVVADLHLEKGSSFATRGVLLPPYDTAATLARLGALVARYAPRFVIALGDSFHDGGGPQRVSDDDRAMLGSLQRGRDWIWIAGNHDPEPVRDLGGVSAAMFADRAAGVPPCAGARGRRRRDRRPSASGGARQRARPHGVAALLRDRRQAHGDAGVRRLYRRPQYPRRAPSPMSSARSNSPRTCWARGGSTPSRRSAACGD